jgi:hypothetical protein
MGRGTLRAGNNVLDLYMLNKMGMFNNNSGGNPTTGGA